MATNITNGEADTYFATRSNAAAYTGASEADQDAALDTAERDLLAHYDYPDVADNLRVPYFIIYLLRKP